MQKNLDSYFTLAIKNLLKVYHRLQCKNENLKLSEENIGK